MLDDPDPSQVWLFLASSGGAGEPTLAWPLALGVVLVCLALSALFSGAEAGFLALSRLQVLELKEQGHAKADMLLRIMEKPSELVGSMMIANVTVNVILFVFWSRGLAPAILGDLATELPLLTLLLNVVVLTTIIVIFAEVTPKAWAHNYPLNYCLTFGSAIPPTMTIVRGAVIAFRWGSESLLKLFGIKPRPVDEVTEEEIIHFIAAGTESGVIDEEGRDLIHSIFEFHDLEVAQVMIPRVDMTMVSNEVSLDEAMQTALDSGHSRIPVFENDRDHVCGVIFVKDMIRSLVTDESPSLPLRDLEIVREVQFVHGTKPISELFAEMKADKFHLAIVVDEYGGTAGLVTIEDLLEELIGDIKDESDVEDPDFLFSEKGELIVVGSLPLHDLSDLVEWEPAENGVETIGGLVYTALGRVPEETEVVDLGGQQVRVLSVEDNRIKEVAFIKAPLTDEAYDILVQQRPHLMNGYGRARKSSPHESSQAGEVH